MYNKKGKSMNDWNKSRGFSTLIIQLQHRKIWYEKRWKIFKFEQKDFFIFVVKIFFVFDRQLEGIFFVVNDIWQWWKTWSGFHWEICLIFHAGFYFATVLIDRFLVDWYVFGRIDISCWTPFFIIERRCGKTKF